ncbi:hypothetical protein SAY87_020733 [Trapa incisa]|uniref:Uncharacterized protein n=1 Tax=Trapa incisa TaxID=236973 RepID=A0AAN7JQ84_9MYRT|nr:hypothetical protein SAY87_020733 [Trapa incisa]
MIFSIKFENLFETKFKSYIIFLLLGRGLTETSRSSEFPYSNLKPSVRPLIFFLGSKNKVKALRTVTGLPENSELPQANRPAVAPSHLISQDDQSIAADSWSITSEYGSTLDDDQRDVDAQDAADGLLSSVNFRTAASEYRF